MKCKAMMGICIYLLMSRHLIFGYWTHFSAWYWCWSEISVKTRPNQFNHEVCEPLAQTNWKKVQIGVKAVGNILQSTQCLITFLRIYQLLNSFQIIEMRVNLKFIFGSEKLLLNPVALHLNSPSSSSRCNHNSIPFPTHLILQE